MVCFCFRLTTEQTEFLSVGPGYRRGRPGLGGFRILAVTTAAAGGGPCGSGVGPSHGPHAGGGGETDSATPQVPRGRPGQSHKSPRIVLRWVIPAVVITRAFKKHSTSLNFVLVF